MAFTKFTVQALSGDRWVLDTTYEDEAKARAYAQNLLKNSKNDGVRVQREKRRADGAYDEQVLFESVKKGDKKKDFSLSEITSAPMCESLADLYQPPARATINRLFVKYLDDALLTPTELLHSYREFKRLMDMDIVQGAVDRVSVLQTTEGDSRVRRDALSGFLDQALARARKASEKTDLPQVKSVGFAEAVKRIDATAPEADRDFLAYVALSRDLIEQRAFIAKLEMVLAEMEKAGPGRTMALLDAVLADILGARGVVPELIGAIPNLGALLMKLIELSQGKMTSAKPGTPLAALNQRLASGQLPESLGELESQFQRQIKSTQPLVRTDPTAEFDTFRKLLSLVVTTEDIFGGPINAEAMTLRYSRFLSKGGAPGRRDAITAMTSYLPTAMQQVRFLIALTSTELGQEQSNFIITSLESLIGKANRMEDLVGNQGTPKTRMTEITQIYKFMSKTTSLPPNVCMPLAEKLDSLVADFLVSNQVLEKLDNPSDSLRIRAIRMIQFCTSGVLPEGRAFAMGRDRVLTMLRQPKFEQKFVADIADQTTHEKALRDFHRVLATSNFLGDMK